MTVSEACMTHAFTFTHTYIHTYILHMDIYEWCALQNDTNPVIQWSLQILAEKGAGVKMDLYLQAPSCRENSISYANTSMYSP